MRRLALAAVAVVGLAACEPAVPYTGDGGRKVFVTGDSLVVESAGLLAGDDRMAVDARHGSDIAWAADQLEWQLVDAPDVAVVASGTNTWIGGWDAGDRAAVRRIVQLAGSIDCLVWITPARRTDFAVTVIDAIRWAAADVPNVHVARWDRHAADHDDWYQADGVHHGATGRAAYARFIQDSVADLCPA